MAILGCDSFAFYDTSPSLAELERRWDDVTQTACTKVTGPFGGSDPALRCPNVSEYVQKYLVSAVTGSFFIQGWFKHENSLWNDSNNAIYAFQEGTTEHINILFSNPGGQIIVKRGTKTGTTIATSTQSCTAQLWQHYMVEVLIHDTTGKVVVHVDGEEFINFTGDTRNGGTAGQVERFKLLATGNAAANHAHVVWWDDQGDAPTAFTEPMRIGAIWPESDDSVQFTPQGAGTNNVEVDEVDCDDDTTYNESSTVGHKDRFAMYTTPFSMDNIYAVQVCAVARKDDAGTREIRVGVYTGTTEDRASSAPLATTYKHFLHLMTKNPDDAAAWEQADIDAIKAQYEVSA
jgi:hypothetical protein